MAAVVLAACAIVLAVSEWGLPRGRDAWRAIGRRSAPALLLADIIALAFELRPWGITSGLPQSYVADEYDFVHAVLRMMTSGDLNPHSWYHPSLEPYLALATFFLAGLGLVLYRMNRALAVFASFPILYYGYYGTQRINYRVAAAGLLLALLAPPAAHGRPLQHRDHATRHR